MKFMHKKTGFECNGTRFNTHSMGEVILYGDTEDGMWSDYPWEYDVFVESIQQWVDWTEARKSHLVITDNYKTRFFEPSIEEDKERGYTLY